MHYDWVPINKRKPLKWPKGKRLALIMTINCEYWDLLKDSKDSYYAGGPQILPDPLPGNVSDYPNFTWREYGQRAGVWRLFKVFEDARAPVSCTFNAKLMLERPEIIAHVKSKGWEVVAHNYEQGELLTRYMFDAKKEREIIRTTLKVYEKTMGKKPKGWLSSSLRSTPRTADIAAEAGLTFFCDLMNDDQPYLIHTDHGPIVSIPYTLEINDFTYFHRRAMTTDDALKMMKSNFDELYAESAKTGKIMNVGIHPHVSGHPHRMPLYREFLKYAKKHDGVWWATREEIAAWYLKNHASHIPPKRR